MELPQRKPLPHQAPAWVEAGSIYFITICTLPRGVDQLCTEQASQNLFDSISLNGGRNIWWPHLVLFMPDHLHGLFSFHSDPGMKKAIKDWKQFVSRNLNINWQRDFFDHRLRTAESNEEKADYIRQNPVRAGLVKHADEWPHIREWKTRVRLEG